MMLKILKKNNYFFFQKKKNSFLPFKCLLTTKSKDRIHILAELVNKDLPSKVTLKEILTSVWNNSNITNQCPDLVIRLTSLRGEVSKKIWTLRGNNPDDIQILAVGTTDIPIHLTSYHKFLENFINNSAKKVIEKKINNKYEIGYDLLSKGSDNARKSVLELFNEHYNFSQDIIESFINNSAITAGGMRGLKDIADACVLYANQNGAIHRFIQPDNSFGTWWNIIEKPNTIDKFRREIHIIETKQANKLHITAEDVHDFYKKYKPTNYESWYVTPVGNPSGTAMKAEILPEFCKAVISYNPNAIIILDCVYVRTLPSLISKQLMLGLKNEPKLLDNIVFIESFSKSHGLCRERLGLYFSKNEKLFTRLHTANIAFSAGPGGFKDEQFEALGNMSMQDKKAIQELHSFWQKERKGLYNFLLKKYSHLFDENQSHITETDINNSCTLYILLKTKNGIKAQDIFLNTGALGVDTPLLSGHYIRFSVGCITKPTYSTYI